jgi:hypothetical protein
VDFVGYVNWKHWNSERHRSTDSRTADRSTEQWRWPPPATSYTQPPTLVRTVARLSEASNPPSFRTNKPHLFRCGYFGVSTCFLNVDRKGAEESAHGPEPSNIAVADSNPKRNMKVSYFSICENRTTYEYTANVEAVPWTQFWDRVIRLRSLPITSLQHQS